MTMAREERSTSRTESGRSARVPLGVARSKLSVPERPGYKRRWVNETEGRLMNAEQGGYQYATDKIDNVGSPDIDNVNRDLGARTCRVVDKTTGQKAYLMEIKEEFYQEDQASKSAAVAEIDNRIKRGKIEDGEGRYVPKGGINIKME